MLQYHVEDERRNEGQIERGGSKAKQKITPMNARIRTWSRHDKKNPTKQIKAKMAEECEGTGDDEPANAEQTCEI